MALPEESADNYPAVREVIPYIKVGIDSWWYNRMDDKFNEAITLQANFFTYTRRGYSLRPRQK